MKPSPSSQACGPAFDVAQWAGQLEACLRGTDIALLEVQAPGVCLRLQRVPDPHVMDKAARTLPVPLNETSDTASVLTAPAARAICQVRAGSVGRLRLVHPLRSQALVQPGQAVRMGQVLALLQIGAVLLPVTAPCAGRVGQWLAQDGALVGYGDPLLDFTTDTDKEARDAD